MVEMGAPAVRKASVISDGEEEQTSSRRSAKEYGTFGTCTSRYICTSVGPGSLRSAAQQSDQAERCVTRSRVSTGGDCLCAGICSSWKTGLG